MQMISLEPPKEFEYGGSGTLTPSENRHFQVARDPQKRGYRQFDGVASGTQNQNIQNAVRITPRIARYESSSL